jgi:thiol-disulfide isomerase/thioredoxin
MKKIYPSIAIVFVFGLLMVLQMVIHGQKLTATKMEDSVERYSAFEDEFSKLKLKTTKGSVVELSKLKAPIVILNFWASWCTPCVKEFPSLNALIDKYPDKVMVVGINNDDETPKKKVKKMESEYKLKFESVVDPNGKIASSFNIKKIPAALIYHKGKIIHFSSEEFDFMGSELLAKLKMKLKL